MRIKFENSELQAMVLAACEANAMKIRGDIIYSEAGYPDREIPEVIAGIVDVPVAYYWAAGEEAIIVVGEKMVNERMRRDTGWVQVTEKLTDRVSKKAQAIIAYKNMNL